MGNLSNLAAAIEGKRPPIADDIDPALARRNAATADAIRAAGVPDAFNRFLPENEHLNMKPPGQKEAQVRALRLSRATAQKPTASAPAPKPATQAKPAAATQEMTMKTKSKTAKKVRKLTKPKTRRKAATEGGSTKLQAIVALLQRPAGCLTSDILAATGWPTVSVPQQATAAGITLKKVKDGKVTRYWDLAFYPKQKAAA